MDKKLSQTMLAALRATVASGRAVGMKGTAIVVCWLSPDFRLATFEALEDRGLVERSTVGAGTRFWPTIAAHTFLASQES